MIEYYSIFYCKKRKPDDSNVNIKALIIKKVITSLFVYFSIRSFTFCGCFILLKVMVDPQPIPGTPGCREKKAEPDASAGFNESSSNDPKHRTKSRSRK